MEIEAKRKGVIYTFLIDDADWPLVSKQHWLIWKSLSGRPYVQNSRGLKLHKLLMGKGDKPCIDHINRDGLDNRRENLRFTTKAGNALNAKTYKSNNLNIKGVRCIKGRYVARITINKKTRQLGTFGTAIEASEVYEAACAKQIEMEII
jgi:hypothetical protein